MGDNRFTYMEPAGFAVDLYESSHTDVTTQAFLPVVNAWINAEGDWLPLPNAALGSFRSTSLGRVFNHSGGVNGTGYAICLDCGKAEPMHKDRSAPKFADAKTSHRRLRGTQGNASRECAGSFKPYAVKPALHLGLETVTDVLELQLNGLDGLPISDPIAAYSLAVALRHAIAAALGVETDEIGCDTKPIRHPVKGIGHVIILYDHSAAGYCSSVADRIPYLLSKAREQLDCFAKCQGGCQHCLLSYDTRFRMDDLDRFAALDFLTVAWMQQLKLQPEDSFFGASSSIAETMSLAESIGRDWNKPGASELRIYLCGSAQDWDVAGSPLKRFVQSWSLHGPVKLIAPSEVISSLSPDQLYALKQLAQWDAVTVHSGASSKASQLTPFAEILNSQNATKWVSRDESCAMPSHLWGKVTRSVLVRGNGLPALEIGKQLELGPDHPTDLSPKAGHLELKAELNGSTVKFGTRLLDRMHATYGKSLVEREDAIKSVVYRDRYINSPLPVMLLLSLMSAMRSQYKDAWKNTTLVEIVSVEVPFDDRYAQAATQVFHNWPTTESRDAAILSAFAAAGTQAVVRNLPKALASHARVLEIGMESGAKLKIWFDQGFGYWVVPKNTSRSSSTANTRFRFNEPASFQGAEISNAQVMIEGQAFSTQIFFEITTLSP
jgi:DEAD/DEAH box helicase domain-containing protein